MQFWNTIATFIGIIIGIAGFLNSEFRMVVISICVLGVVVSLIYSNTLSINELREENTRFERNRDLSVDIAELKAKVSLLEKKNG